MKKKTEDLLNQLVDQLENKEDFDKVRDQLLKRGVESLLKAEMSAHLGHLPNKPPLGDNIRNGHSEKTIKTTSGDQRIKVPRDRQGTFDPVIVPKHKSMSQELEDCVLLLYAKGMSNADIIDFLAQTYKINYSTSQVSIITNQMLEEIKIWQTRPLQDQYAVVWIDAIHYKLDRKVRLFQRQR